MIIEDDDNRAINLSHDHKSYTSIALMIHDLVEEELIDFLS